MRFFSCDQLYQGDVYRLSSLRGDLRFFHRATPREPHSAPRVREVLSLCDDPYLLDPDELETLADHTPGHQEIAATILRRMLTVTSLGFALARLYASRRTPLFPNSQSAIRWFHANTPSADRNRLCLPRSLFAAKTSAEFATSGAVVIGTMLPTRNLHAWVIEQRRQPDDADRVWVCYRPIGILLQGDLGI